LLIPDVVGDGVARQRLEGQGSDEVFGPFGQDDANLEVGFDKQAGKGSGLEGRDASADSEDDSAVIADIFTP